MTSVKRRQMYRQCHLQRVDSAGAVHHTIGFIPEQLAIPGRSLRLTIRKDSEDGWVVMAAGKQLFPQDLLVNQSQDYKRMRKASDI